jgi:hypothetical protein
MNLDGVADLHAQLQDSSRPLEGHSENLPSLVAVVRARTRQVDYVLLEAAADHARIRTYRGENDDLVIDEVLDGEHEYVHEAISGGFSHPRHAHRTEEVWKRNAGLFAGAADRIVAQGGIDFVVITGDPHVVDLLTAALSDDSRHILTTVQVDTLAAGASKNVLERCVTAETIRIRDERLRVDLDDLSAQADLGGRTGLSSVVAELQEASVATLFIDESELTGIRLTALADHPWIAPARESSDFQMSALAALVRAAVLTGSELVFVESGALPGGTPVAAITRWTPDGQAATLRADPSFDDARVHRPAHEEGGPRLTSHHRVTLQRILQHPVGRNIEWQDALSLLQQAGTVQKGHDGKIKITLGNETETLDRPPSKDLTVRDVVDLRRMLRGAGFDKQ